jgi:hypothetical protein
MKKERKSDDEDNDVVDDNTSLDYSSLHVYGGAQSNPPHHGRSKRSHRLSPNSSLQTPKNVLPQATYICAPKEQPCGRTSRTRADVDHRMRLPNDSGIARHHKGICMEI